MTGDGDADALADIAEDLGEVEVSDGRLDGENRAPDGESFGYDSGRR